MRYRNLGRTGIKVSPYAFGTLPFAIQVGNPDPKDSIRIIHKELDAGINLVDTADEYGNSEEIVRRVLQGCWENVVLTAKVSRPMDTDPNQQGQGASRWWIMTAVENSLRHLQTDHIDVYQLHRPGPDTDGLSCMSHVTQHAQRRVHDGLTWSPTKSIRCAKPALKFASGQISSCWLMIGVNS